MRSSKVLAAMGKILIVIALIFLAYTAVSYHKAVEETKIKANIYPNIPFIQALNQISYEGIRNRAISKLIGGGLLFIAGTGLVIGSKKIKK